VLGIEIYDSQRRRGVPRHLCGRVRPPFTSGGFDVELLARFIRRKRATVKRRALLCELPCRSGTIRKGSLAPPTSAARSSTSGNRRTRG
jgi:hypothetical protein